MNQDLNKALEAWNLATGNLKYGVQRVFHDVFQLASEGKTHLVYGADYNGGFPCLVNTVGTMLTTGGGAGVPMANFSEVVSLFDSINNMLLEEGVNEERGHVSPFAAEIFIHNFAPLKSAPELKEKINEAGKIEEFAQGMSYREPTDEEMARDLIEAFMTDAPVDNVDTQEAIFNFKSDNEITVEVQYHPKSE